MEKTIEVIKNVLDFIQFIFYIIYKGLSFGFPDDYKTFYFGREFYTADEYVLAFLIFIMVCVVISFNYLFYWLDFNSLQVFTIYLIWCITNVYSTTDKSNLFLYQFLVQLFVIITTAIFLLLMYIFNPIEFNKITNYKEESIKVETVLRGSDFWVIREYNKNGENGNTTNTELKISKLNFPESGNYTIKTEKRMTFGIPHKIGQEIVSKGI